MLTFTSAELTNPPGGAGGRGGGGASFPPGTTRVPARQRPRVHGQALWDTQVETSGLCRAARIGAWNAASPAGRDATGEGYRRTAVALTDEAIEKIKAMIISGTLRAGDRLPKEADLAADLGLSRSSLREAVKALSLMNILDVRRGDGTYVTSLEPPVLLEALSFIVDFHRDNTVLEFLRVRRILEPAATAMAAERIRPEETEGLGKLLDSLGPETGVEDLVANDLEFHRRIAACSGNSVLCSLLETLAGPTTRARVWRGLTQADAIGRTLAEHRAILDALASHDPEVARSWSTVHIASVEQWLASVL
jgi:GntR family transcriptional regulator, transcriptional repressor for pyruvate dehydrogenase complex